MGAARTVDNLVDTDLEYRREVKNMIKEYIRYLETYPEDIDLDVADGISIKAYLPLVGHTILERYGSG